MSQLDDKDFERDLIFVSLEDKDKELKLALKDMRI